MRQIEVPMTGIYGARVAEGDAHLMVIGTEPPLEGVQRRQEQLLRCVLAPDGVEDRGERRAIRGRAGIVRAKHRCLGEATGVLEENRRVVAHAAGKDVVLGEMALRDRKARR